eukprot:GHVT01104355.1.p1 GENE.GHVT01104355.1~~GHVT01104355.1.p1  ORF type:complete len:224 (-),score=36.92 GHVT01104355.1:112-783(-)
MGCAQSAPVLGGEELRVNEALAVNPSPSLPSEPPRNLDVKIVLLGESGVGKSSLAVRFCQGRFSPFHEVTIGAAFLQQSVRLADGTQMKLHIWDTGGQERFRAMASLYYRDAAAAIIVYDSTDAASYSAVNYWINELRDKGPPNCVIAVAANKSDVPEGKVDTQVSREFFDKNQMIFVECSAKTGENVSMMFERLALAIRNSILDSSSSDPHYGMMAPETTGQ